MAGVGTILPFRSDRGNGSSRQERTWSPARHAKAQFARRLQSRIDPLLREKGLF